MTSNPPRRLFLCDECGAPFKSMIRLRRHMGEKPFQCSTCDTRFEKRRGLNVHLKLKFRCKYCCRVLKKPNALEEHLELCASGQGTKPSKRETTPQDDEMKKLSNGPRPYECTTCLKTFKHLKCVQTHVTRCSTKSKGERKKGRPLKDLLKVSVMENSPATTVDLEESSQSNLSSDGQRDFQQPADKTSSSTNGDHRDDGIIYEKLHPQIQEIPALIPI